ncbi:DDE-type integrase/transposase/recombinase [Candidatus Woesearchaeota archaeon]|nr:DDE-type integrase/transposase/recombinase [Candidatus Woesearchaeota archaeon]
MHRKAQITSPKSRNSLENKNISCPKCKCKDTIKKGFRETKHRGKQQRHICKKCKFSFTVDDGFWKMKSNPKKIMRAIDTYYEGLSLRKIKRNFEKYGVADISHQTVLNWIRKYVYLIRKGIEKMQPVLDGHYVTDEVVIRCKGANHNFGLVMDKKTRYVVATRYSEEQYISREHSIKLWSKAKSIKKPYKLTSDAHGTYMNAFNEVFYTRYKKDMIEYEQVNAFKTGKFNFVMERVWNTLRERIKIMRGFKATWSAKLLVDGFFIWYNFIRPHMTFGRTPAENAGINVNDWLGLVRMTC